MTRSGISRCMPLLFYWDQDFYWYLQQRGLKHVVLRLLLLAWIILKTGVFSCFNCWISLYCLWIWPRLRPSKRLRAAQSCTARCRLLFMGKCFECLIEQNYNDCSFYHLCPGHWFNSFFNRILKKRLSQSFL